MNYPAKFVVELSTDAKLPHDGLGLHVHSAACFKEVVALLPPVIGHIQTTIGSSTLTRACGIAVQIKVDDPVCQGDVIETAADSRVAISFVDGTAFDLGSGTRMVLNEFVCESNGSSHSALFGVTGGAFAFIVGQVAKTDYLRIDTPVGSIRGRARTGGIGMLSLTALTFAVMKEVQAASPDVTFLDDGKITYSDLEHGVFELVTRDGRHIIVDNPGETIVLSRTGSITVVTNSDTRMAELQQAQQDALAIYAQGTNATPTSTGPSGSSTSPSLLLPSQGLQLLPIDFIQPNVPIAPQNSQSATTTTQLVVPVTDTILFTPNVLTTINVAPVVDNPSFVIANQVQITDPITTDVIVPYVPGSATIISVVGPSPPGVDLKTLVAVDPATGAVTYDPTSFAFLGGNQKVVVTIGFNSQIGSNTFHETLNVTIDGVNQVPAIVAGSTTATGAVGEAAAITGSAALDGAAGSIAFADVNLFDVHTVSQAAPTFVWSGGTLSASQIAALTSASTLALTESDSTGSGAGAVAWKYSAADKSFDFLAAGQTLTVTYTVTVTDNNGLFTTQLITVLITGTNDAPVIISGTQAAAFTANSTTPDTASGAVSFTDADLSDTHAVTVTGVVASGVTSGLPNNATLKAWLSLGPLTDSTNGATGSDTWTFSAADSNFDYLAAGQTVTLTYTVQVTDGHGGVVTQPVTVTITGTNAAPVITSGTQTGTITERTGVTGSTALDTTSGAVTFTDADLSDTHAVTVTGVVASGVTSGLPNNATLKGWLSLGPLTDSTNGATGSDTWTFSAQDKNFDYLAAGQTVTLTYTVQVADGHGGIATEPVTITITGTNDAAVISGKSTGSVEIADDGPGSGSLIATGALTDTDVDNPANTFIAVTTATKSTGGYGTFTITAAGAWTYTLTNSPNLGEGQHLSDTFTVHTVDGTAQVVTITINDSDTAPAGVAGSAINLGLTQLAGVGGEAVTVTGVPLNWTINGATHNADGSWTALTNDFSTLTITPDINFVGATVVHVAETWTNPDGSTGSMIVSDNVEAYAPASPIFAIAGDDHLTGTGKGDQFVFAQPIGNDIIYNFGVTSDEIDLIGFSNIASFADIQGNIADDANGNAVITIGANETITLNGVHAASVTASDFVFNQTPNTVNPGTMQIGDGAQLPLSGTVNNTGTIELNSTGDVTDLQLIQHGITLTGAGKVVLSDNVENVIGGTSADVTLTNVDNTISGAGQIGAGQLTLINQGTIDATGARPLNVDTGVNVVTNSGTLEATGSGGLIVNSNILNSGLIWAHGGNITINGAVTGTGSALIDGAATLEFAAASSANVTFTGNNFGTLVLDNPTAYTGQIFGFTGTDPQHSDLIDLKGIIFDAGTSWTYYDNAGSGTGGTLTVFETINGVATAVGGISFANGDYTTANFILTTDGHGGTLIADPPAGSGTPGASDFFSLVGNPASFAIGSDGNGSAEIGSNHQMPVIETDQLSIAQKPDGAATISGFQIVDTDPTACTEVCAVAGTTDASGSGVTTPPTGFGLLADLNTALNNGFTYNPGSMPPAIDKVTLAGADSFGPTHTQNFIFSEPAADANIAPQGTSGQHVFLATADQFVFAPTSGTAAVQHTITDFAAGLDKIDIRQFGNIRPLADLTEAQQGTDAQITLDNHDTLLLKNVNATNLHASDFIIHA